MAVALLFLSLCIVFRTSKEELERHDSSIPKADLERSSRLADRADPQKLNARIPVALDETFDASNYKNLDYLPGSFAAGDDGTRAYLRIPSTRTRVSLAPNSMGEYPIQAAGLRESVGIRLIFPDIAPGTPVAVAILDGGSFPESKGFSRIVRVEEWGGIDFQFETSANLGHHRLQVLPRGKTPKTLDFYAAQNPEEAPL